MRIHYLKIAPRFFNDVDSGIKPFECRKNDRDYKVDDILIFQEWIPAIGYTGRETKKKVTYLLKGGVFGIHETHCVLGLCEYVKLKIKGAATDE